MAPFTDNLGALLCQWQTVDLDHVIQHPRKDADKLAIALPVEAGVISKRCFYQPGKVNGAEQAGTVLRQSLFTTRIGCPDIFAEPVIVHLIVLVDEDKAGFGIVVGGCHYHVPQLTGRNRFIDETGNLALVIADPAAIRHITDTAHRLNPSLHIVARTRFVSEIEPLRSLGAREVIPEEFETSVEIFNRVLSAYLVPRRDIDRFTAEIRAEGNGLLRRVEESWEPSCDMSGVCSGFDVVAIQLDPGSYLEGRSLEEVQLRKVHGLNVVAVQRQGQMMPNPDAKFQLQAGDVVYVFAEQARVVDKGHLFTAVGNQ